MRRLFSLTLPALIAFSSLQANVIVYKPKEQKAAAVAQESGGDSPLDRLYRELDRGSFKLSYGMYHHKKNSVVEYKPGKASKKYHTVKPGDALSVLARRYHTSVDRIKELNHLKNNRIFVGQKLVVATSTAAVTHSSFPSNKLSWPLKGRNKIRKHFRKKGHNINLGIVIDARFGDSVRASQDGKVVRIGQMRGYGRYVIVAHEDHLLTVYACLDRISVKSGQSIKRGQGLGTLKRRDNFLHFQVGYYGKPVNPLKYVNKPA